MNETARRSGTVGRVRCAFVVVCVLVTVGCSGLRRAQELTDAFELLFQIQAAQTAANAPTFRCPTGAEPGTLLSTSDTNSLSAYQQRFYYFPAETSGTYTFRLTTSSGDADLYVYTEIASVDARFASTVEFFSVLPGGSVDQISAVIGAGRYRCLRVSAPQPSGYLLSGSSS